MEFKDWGDNQFWEEECSKCGKILRAYTEEDLKNSIEYHKEVCPRK